MRKSLASMYDRLRPAERYQLVVTALSRADEQEAARLANTCPRKRYEMHDLHFSERLRASHLISSYVCMELMELVSTLRTIETYREVVETYEKVLFSSLEQATVEAALSFHQGWDAGCDHAWQAAGKHGPFPWNDKDNLSERAEEMAERIRAHSRSETSDVSPQDTLEKISEALSVRARTIWEAFSRFCRGQTGLEPETVLQACFPPSLGLPKELEDVAGSAQVDSVSLEDYEATLVHTWCELVGKSN